MNTYAEIDFLCSTMNYDKLKKILKGNSIKKIEEDLFIKRLRSLVIGEGMLHEGNIYLMNFAMKNMPTGGNVLEIGSYGGLSTSLILHLLKKNNRVEKLINCEPWVYEGYRDSVDGVTAFVDGREDLSRADYSKYMKEAFMNSMQFLNKERLPFTFHMTSDEFFTQYEQGLLTKDLFGQETQMGVPLSFAYIDGDHSYEYVKRDFNNVDKYLLESGFILFDDSMDEMSFGSAIFMKEMKENKNYQLITKNPNYLFKKVKG